MSGSGGRSADPQQEDRARHAEPAGIIEELGSSDGPSTKAAGSVWDRVLAAFFALAVVVGVVIAMTNGAGAPPGDPAASTLSTTVAAQPTAPLRGERRELHPGIIEPVTDVRRRRFTYPGTYRIDDPFPVSASSTLPRPWEAGIW